MKQKALILSVFLLALAGVGCTDKNSNIDKMLSEKKYYEVISVLEGMNSKTAKNYLQLADAYRELRKLAIADSYYVIALEKNPALRNEVVKSYSNIASTDFMKGYTSNAIKYWQKILELNSAYDINIGFYHLGKHYFDNKDYVSAKPLLINSMSISLPSHDKIQTYRMLIEIFKSEMKFDTAMSYAERASMEFSKAQDPETDFKVAYGEMKFTIAKEKYLKKNYDEALSLLLEFIDNPSPLSLIDDAHLYVGNIYFDLNNNEKAIYHYKKVIEYSDVKVYGSNDTYEEANNKLKEILKRTMQ
ncbi:MAG: tetratricopeptide repeat protein [bacterium]